MNTFDKIKQKYSELNDIVMRFSNKGISGVNIQQKAVVIGAAVAVVLLLFVITGVVLSSKKEDAEIMAQTAHDRLRLAQVLTIRALDAQNNSKALSTSLQQHIEGIGPRYSIRGAILNIRLINSSNKQEQVSFRAENLVYKEFTYILNDLEQYDNVWVKSVDIKKRYDNPERIDVSFDVVREEA